MRRTHQVVTASIDCHTLVYRLTEKPCSFVSGLAAAVTLNKNKINFSFLDFCFKPILPSIHTLFISLCGWYLSRSDIDAGGVGMAASVIRTMAVIDWLTLISILCPSSQTLTEVCTRTCFYAFSLQGAVNSVKRNSTGVQEIMFLTYIDTTAASERRSAGIRLYAGDPITLESRITDTPGRGQSIQRHNKFH